MTPDRFEEILANNGFEPVECFWVDFFRIITLTHCGGALSEGMKIVFTEEPDKDKIPSMGFETFDNEMVEVEPEVALAIAYCINNFDSVWNYFYKKGE